MEIIIKLGKDCDKRDTLSVVESLKRLVDDDKILWSCMVSTGNITKGSFYWNGKECIDFHTFEERPKDRSYTIKINRE